ncbi:MAG: MaoC family dehydratase N-terminal domain-containing protein [Deltaproteobacteria bacterium]|nr:MaoC family dehydratase N-terminal domain-containing protein [Deltaproteobacteria bacterium]MCL5276649.1 MaoC family dehydratase N-terminal domain-containing protein [Deltaproteobacteria bacterium]
MAVDKKFIGKKYPPVEYEVCREKIKEYATAVGDLNPLYMDEQKAKQGPYKGIVAPPLFVVVYAKDVLSQALFDHEMALNIAMLVHGEQEYEFVDVVRPGDVILTEGYIADIYEKSDKDFVVVGSTSKRKSDGKVLSRGKWTFVIRR